MFIGSQSVQTSVVHLYHLVLTGKHWELQRLVNEVRITEVLMNRYQEHC